MLGYFLENLSEKQKNEIKSIIIVGENEVSAKTCEILINMYLNKSN